MPAEASQAAGRGDRADFGLDRQSARPTTSRWSTRPTHSRPKRSARPIASSGRFEPLASSGRTEGGQRSLVPHADRQVRAGTAWKRKGIAANGPADRRKLIRRAYFDLIGLPPTPDEVEAFVADPAAGRLRAADRSAARQPALRRALGPALARPGPLRREPRLRAGLRPAHRLSLSRLRHPGAQSRTCRTTDSCGCKSPATSSSRTTTWP